MSKTIPEMLLLAGAFARRLAEALEYIRSVGSIRRASILPTTEDLILLERHSYLRLLDGTLQLLGLAARCDPL